MPNIADNISKAAPWAIYGVFLIGFMYLMPVGVSGAIRIAWAKMHQRKSSTPQRSGQQPPGQKPIVEGGPHVS